MDSIEINALQDIVSSSGAAGATSVNVLPNEGEVWELVNMYAYHNDNTAARTITMKLYDSTNNFTLASWTAVANGTIKDLLVDGSWSKRIILSRKFYAIVEVNAIDAAKQLTVVYYIRKIKGLPVDLGA